eukprot:1003744-Prymnesium_polylepis.1
MVDKQTIYDATLEHRRQRFDQGLVGKIEAPNDITDELQKLGASVHKTTDVAVGALKTLTADLRALEHDYGLLGCSPAAAADAAAVQFAFMCYPLPVTDEVGVPLAATSLNERRLLVLDEANSALRMVETAKGEVTTLLGGRSVGHADGILNVAKLKAP